MNWINYAKTAAASLEAAIQTAIHPTMYPPTTLEQLKEAHEALVLSIQSLEDIYEEIDRH